MPTQTPSQSICTKRPYQEPSKVSSLPCFDDIKRSKAQKLARETGERRFRPRNMHAKAVAHWTRQRILGFGMAKSLGESATWTQSKHHINFESDGESRTSCAESTLCHHCKLQAFCSLLLRYQAVRGPEHVTKIDSQGFSSRCCGACGSWRHGLGDDLKHSHALSLSCIRQ